jgi:ferredoxin
MKVKVDFDRCQSNALCEALAPKVFEVDDDDYLHVLREEVDGDDLEPVRRAVAACPTQAISLLEG